MKRFIFALLLIFCAATFAAGPLRTNTATEIMVTLLDSSGDPVTSLTSIGGIEIWLYTIAYDAATITEQTEITPTASGGNNDMVHKHNGLWTLELTAGNTNFVGRLNIAIYDADNTEFILYDNSYAVYSANIFDSQFGGDYQQVDTKQLDGSGVQQLSGYIKVSDGTGTGQIQLTSGAVDVVTIETVDATDKIADAVLDETLTGTNHNGANTVGKRIRQIEHVAVLREEEEAQAASASTITLHDDASSINDFYDDAEIVITGGTGIEQMRHIHGYVGSSRIATIHPDWVTTPGGTIKYVIRGESQKHVHTVGDDAITAATFASDVDAEIAAYILNAATNAYGGAGTYGQAIEDTLADTGELQTNQGAWATATSVDLEDNAITAAKITDAAWQELIELLFDFDATATYATADAGSLVKQIAGNSTATIPPRLE